MPLSSSWVTLSTAKAHCPAPGGPTVPEDDRRESLQGAQDRRQDRPGQVEERHALRLFHANPPFNGGFARGSPPLPALLDDQLAGRNPLQLQRAPPPPSFPRPRAK